MVNEVHNMTKKITYKTIASYIMLFVIAISSATALSYGDTDYFGKYSVHTTSWRNYYGSGHEYEYTYTDAGGSDHIYSTSFHPRSPWTCIGSGCGKTW